LVAVAHSLDDELLTYEIDLDMRKPIKETIFNFAKHRRPEHYKIIVDRIGAVPPPE
jgi:hypothetical protein